MVPWFDEGDRVEVVGPARLSGIVTPKGFKHTFVPIAAASLLLDGPLVLSNVPSIADTHAMSNVIRFLGGHISPVEPDGLFVDPKAVRFREIPDLLTSETHGALYFLPTMLARFGRMSLGRTGGCRLGNLDVGGERPLHHLLSVMRAFGAHCVHEGDTITGHCTKLYGTSIDIRTFSERTNILCGPLVSGATKTALLTAALAFGESEVVYPYRKPDVDHLVQMLTNAGLVIETTPQRIRIQGTGGRLLSGVHHELPPDFIHIFTLIATSVYLEQPISIRVPDLLNLQLGLKSELARLKSLGIQLNHHATSDGWVHINVIPPKTMEGGIHIDVTSESIYSDNQPFFALMLTKASRPSTITDGVWKHRFDYAYQLNKLGANMNLNGNRLQIRPRRPSVSDCTVTAIDLRAAATLIIAALGIDGHTAVSGIGHLFRGYENLLGDFRLLGATIGGCSHVHLGRILST